MENILSWLATAATITAASVTASNLGSRITGYGFIIFTIGSIAWFNLGLLTNQPPLVWTNAVLTFLNLFGVWRWLGRQTRIEKGAEAAAEASQARPGESLFPVSLMMRARIEDRHGNALGACIDAMAGCDSGRIRYVVVSEGGVAGVGETLRRLDWSQACVRSDKLVAQVDRAAFCALPEVRRDDWPTG